MNQNSKKIQQKDKTNEPAITERTDAKEKVNTNYNGKKRITWYSLPEMASASPKSHIKN